MHSIEMCLKLFSICHHICVKNMAFIDGYLSSLFCSLGCSCSCYSSFSFFFWFWLSINVQSTNKDIWQSLHSSGLHPVDIERRAYNGAKELNPTFLHYSLYFVTRRIESHQIVFHTFIHKEVLKQTILTWKLIDKINSFRYLVLVFTVHTSFTGA